MTAENHSPPARSLRRTQCTNLWVVYIAPLVTKGFPASPVPAAFSIVPACPACENEFQQQHDIIICQEFRLLQKTFSIPPRVQSRCVRSFRVSCFNWCCNAFSSLMAFRSFFSLFSSSRLSFSALRVSGKGSVLLSRYQHINSIRFSHALTHPHDKSGGFQFIQRTLDRHGTAGQDCGNGCDREADKQDSVLVLLPFG